MTSTATLKSAMPKEPTTAACRAPVAAHAAPAFAGTLADAIANPRDRTPQVAARADETRTAAVARHMERSAGVDDQGDRMASDVSAAQSTSGAGGRPRKDCRSEHGEPNEGAVAGAIALLGAGISAVACPAAAPVVLAATSPEGSPGAALRVPARSLRATSLNAATTLADMSAPRAADAGSAGPALPVTLMHQATHFAPAKVDLHFDAGGLRHDEPGHWLALGGRAPHDRPPIAGVEIAPSAAGGMPVPIGMQVFKAIVDEVGAAAATEASTATPAAEPTSWSASGPALRTLSLQLSPAFLGPVTLVLSRCDGGLRIQLDAEREETVAMVQREGDELTSRLQDAGYTIEEFLVRQSPDTTMLPGSSDPPQASRMPSPAMAQGSHSWHAGSEQSPQRPARQQQAPAQAREPAPHPDSWRSAAAAIVLPRVAGSRFFGSV